MEWLNLRAAKIDVRFATYTHGEFPDISRLGK